MTPPTSPYATSSEVALLLRNLIHKVTDFDATTTPPKDTVDNFILWVSGEIDMRLFAAGYNVPLETLEEWPLYQTTYLKMLAALGAGAMVLVGLKPAPAMGPSKEGSSQSVLKNMYNSELNALYHKEFKTITNPLRAAFRLGTAAERALTEPVGPKSTSREEPTTLWAHTCYTKNIVNEEVYYEDLISDYLRDIIYES